MRSTRATCARFSEPPLRAEFAAREEASPFPGHAKENRFRSRSALRAPSENQQGRQPQVQDSPRFNASLDHFLGTALPPGVSSELESSALSEKAWRNDNEDGVDAIRYGSRRTPENEPNRACVGFERDPTAATTGKRSSDVHPCVRSQGIPRLPMSTGGNNLDLRLTPFSAFWRLNLDCGWKPESARRQRQTASDFGKPKS